MRATKRAPVHPGRILLNDYILPLRITLTSMASILGVSRKTVSAIVNERKSVTPDMALRLSMAFSTTPDLWLNLQKNYDLWHAARKDSRWKSVKPISQDVCTVAAC